MTDSWKVLLDALPSVVAELIVAIRVVVAAKLVSANEISPTAARAREKVMVKTFNILIEFTELITYLDIHTEYYCK